MNDDPNTNTPGQGPQATRDAWDEVGRQFQILGETLAAAFRASWHSPEQRKRVQAMQGSLEDMVKHADQAIQDAAASPHAQEARQEAKKVAESLRDAGEQTVQEVRPHLLSALKQVNDELQKLVNRMDSSTPPPHDDAQPEERKP
jgi:phage-related minor tail protein